MVGAVLQQHGVHVLLAGEVKHKPVLVAGDLGALDGLDELT